MRRYTLRTLTLEILLIIAALIFVSPIYVMVNVAVKSTSNTTDPITPAFPPTFDNFTLAWNDAHLGNALTNTTVITVLSIAIVVLVSSLAGYTIARLTTRFSRTAFITFQLGLLLPFQLATIPLYQAMFNLRLLGTVWSLVLYYSGLLLPISIFLYASFIRALPRDYEEAAEADGAGPVRVFFLIVFPMMRAVTGTVIILNSVGVWNDFFTPRLYLAGSGVETVTVALYSYVGQYSTQWPLIFGGLIIASLPILVMFFILQKKVIEGFAGGLKG
jgi:raffinose/stachyose/melibiose transport system permease protein